MSILRLKRTQLKPDVFNLLGSRANLHLSYNPAGRSHCRLQNHHGNIKHHHSSMGGSPGDVGEVLTMVKPRKGCRMSYDVGKAAEGLENELWRRLRLILQPLHRFTYVTAHSPILPPLYPRQSSFSNPSAALPTSQLILQPFRCFTYVIGTSRTSQLILKPFRRFTYVTGHNPSVASPTSQGLHVLHLESRPCIQGSGGLACYS